MQNKRERISIYDLVPRFSPPSPSLSSSSSSCCIFPVNALARPSRYRGTIEIVTPMAGRLISRCNRETSISVPLSPPLLADPGSLGVDASAINMKAACRIVALIHPTIHSLHRRYPAVIRELAGTRRPVARTELGSNGTSASPIVHLRASSQHPSPGRYKSLISRTGRSSKTRSLGHRAAYRFASMRLYSSSSPSSSSSSFFDLYSIVYARCMYVYVHVYIFPL